MIEHLRDLIPQTLERLGIAGRLRCELAALQWPTVVEGVRPGAAAASVARVGRQGTLVVSVRSSAWQTELAAHEADLMTALNDCLGCSSVARLRFRVVGRDLH